MNDLIFTIGLYYSILALTLGAIFVIMMIYGLINSRPRKIVKWVEPKRKQGY